MNVRFLSRAVVFAAFIPLTACSMGSNAAGIVPPPSQAGGARANAGTEVSFVINTTRATTPLGRKVVTLSISFVGNKNAPLQLRPFVLNCFYCSGTIVAPVGMTTFFVDAFDRNGKHLSRSWLREWQDSPEFTMTLASTVGNVALSADNVLPTFGKPAIIHVYVMAQASDDMTFIVGPGSYSHPIPLSVPHESRMMPLSSSSISSAADAVPTLKYAGGETWGAVTAKSMLYNSSVVVVPALASSPVALPRGTPSGQLAGAGPYVWAVAMTPHGTDIVRVDDATGKTHSTTLSPYKNRPGELTGSSNGTVWYGGCNPPLNPQGSFANGVGYILASGSTGFFVQDLAFQCPPLTIGADGNIWYPGGSSAMMTSMTPKGVATTVASSPGPNQDAEVIKAPDGSLWALQNVTPTAPLVHFSRAGALLGMLGSGFSSIAYNGADRIFAFNQAGSISAYDLSGTLKEAYAPQVPPGDTVWFSRPAVASDGALWLVVAKDAFTFNYFVARIGADRTLAEFVLPNATGIEDNEIAVTSGGWLWYVGYGKEVELERAKLPAAH